MGKTFSTPTYRYEESTVPDLVDGNGPLYQRTPVNMGNITPNGLVIDIQKYTSDALSHHNVSLDIVSHDLSVVRFVAAPVESNSDEPLFIYRVVGDMTVDMPTEAISPLGEQMTTFGVYVSFQPFTVQNGYCQSVITNAELKRTSPTVVTYGFSGNAIAHVVNGTIQNMIGSLTLCGAPDDDQVSFADMSETFTLF